MDNVRKRVSAAGLLVLCKEGIEAKMFGETGCSAQIRCSEHYKIILASKSLGKNVIGPIGPPRD